VRYSKELKAAVLQRMMAPGHEAIGTLAKEFNVTEATLYAWRREALKAGAVMGGTGAVPEQWSGAAKFAVVLETASLPQAELAEYCRRKGLYIEQIQAWRAQCEGAFDSAASGPNAAAVKVERKRIRALEQELKRKEKALAEAAALLILRKKAAAIWGEKEEE
jgi:transposase-like protein